MAATEGGGRDKGTDGAVMREIGGYIRRRVGKRGGGLAGGVVNVVCTIVCRSVGTAVLSVESYWYFFGASDKGWNTTARYYKQ